MIMARDRRGADLVVILKDGQQASGELIAVKSDSLLLLSAEGAAPDLGRKGSAPGATRTPDLLIRFGRQIDIRRFIES
jgi:hypothetical protein